MNNALAKIRVVVGFEDFNKIPFDFKAWCVSLWTRSKYVHSKVLIDDTWIHATLEGVKLEKFKEEDLKDEKFDFVEIDNVYLSEDQYNQLQFFMKSVEGASYDWMQIFLSQFIRFGVDHLSKWTCSELATKILQLCYVKEVLLKRPERVSPKDLAEIFGLRDK